MSEWRICMEEETSNSDRRLWAFMRTKRHNVLSTAIFVSIFPLFHVAYFKSPIVDILFYFWLFFFATFRWHCYQEKFLFDFSYSQKIAISIARNYKSTKLTVSVYKKFTFKIQIQRLVNIFPRHSPQPFCLYKQLCKTITKLKQLSR